MGHFTIVQNRRMHSREPPGDFHPNSGINFQIRPDKKLGNSSYPPAAGTAGGTELILAGQHTAHVLDGTAGAGHSAHTAAETLGIIDDSHIVNHLDGTGSTDLLAHATADTADFTHSTGVFALVVVGALDHDVVCHFVDADQVLGAVGDALAAGDALILIDLGDAQVVDGDSTELTSDDTLLAADAAVDALGVGSLAGAAAAVTGVNSGLVGDLLLTSQNNFPLLICCRACRGGAGCSGARRRADSKPR